MVGLTTRDSMQRALPLPWIGEAGQRETRRSSALALSRLEEIPGNIWSREVQGRDGVGWRWRRSVLVTEKCVQLRPDGELLGGHRASLVGRVSSCQRPRD